MRKVLRGYTPGRFRLELLCMCGGPHRGFSYLASFFGWNRRLARMVSLANENLLMYRRSFRRLF